MQEEEEDSPPSRRDGASRLVRFGMERRGAPPAPPAPLVIHPAAPEAAPAPMQRHPAAIPERRRHPRPPAPLPEAAAPARPRRASRLISFGTSRPGFAQGLLARWGKGGLGLLVALLALALTQAPPAAGLGPRLVWMAPQAGFVLGLGAVAGLLGRRGWTGWPIALLMAALALHPAGIGFSQGAGGVLGAGAAAFVLAMALDRIEAVGDARGEALMALVLALLLVPGLAPAGAPAGLLALALLPVARRGIRSQGLAGASYAAVLLPAAAVALALPEGLAGLVGPLVPPERGLGALLPWMRGNPAAPALGLLTLLLFVPGLLAVLVRLRGMARERARPVTALFALAAGPMTMLADSMMVRPGALLEASAVSLAGLAAWMVATPLAAAERRGLVLLCWAGTAAGWALLLLSRGSAEAALLRFLAD